QLTVRSAYTYSKTLDNVSEIFNTFGGGNTLAFAQNPVDTNKGEYSFSGLDYPHTWSITFTEQLPFFREQKGFFGHLLGGWGASYNHILQNGQRYTPAQITAVAAVSDLGGLYPGQPFTGDFYDFGFIGGIAGLDLARPFLGSLSAPATAVGIFAGD